MTIPVWEEVCYPLYIYDKIARIEKRLGNEGLIREIVDRILQGELSRGLRLHQITGTPGYAVDINYHDRLYFTTITRDNKKCLFLLDIIEHHKYRPIEDKFETPLMIIQFLRKYFPAVRRVNDYDYVVQTADGVENPLVDFFDKNLKIIEVPTEAELAHPIPTAKKKSWEPISLTYHGTSFIHPTEQQEEILASIKYPAFFEGVPGSGKSFIALKILYTQYQTLCQRLETVKEDAMGPLRLVYLCESELLCDQMQKNWHINYPELVALSDPEQTPPGIPQVLFYTYYQLITGVKKSEFQNGRMTPRREPWQVDPRQVIDETYFTTWYKTYLDENKNRRKLKLSHHIDPTKLTSTEINLLEHAEKVYAKLRACAYELSNEASAPAHAAEACTATNADDNFLKSVLQNIYQHYEMYLAHQQKIDLAFLKLPADIKNRFSSVVFDEIQDDTDIQISNVYQLVDSSDLGEPVYFAGFYDGHQSLSYTESKLTAINQLFQKKGQFRPSLQIYQLCQSHRTTAAVIEYLNAVLNLEVNLFGRESKNQYIEIALGENYEQGSVHLLSSTEFEASPHFNKLANLPHVAIITSNDHTKAELKANPKYNDFTVIETALNMKGLENEIVIVKGVLAKFIRLSHYLADKPPVKKINPGRFKPDTQMSGLLNHELITELHELYVALSRPKNHLIIIEEPKDLERLTGLIRWLKLFVSQAAPSSLDVLFRTEELESESTESMLWHEKMIELIDHQHLDAAERIFIKKLHRGDSHAFRLWLTDYQNSHTINKETNKDATLETLPLSVSSSPNDKGLISSTSPTNSTKSVLTPTISDSDLDSQSLIELPSDSKELDSLDDALSLEMENPSFNFSELKRFIPEVVYSFQPNIPTELDPSEFKYNGSDMLTAGKWLDILSAYLYMENKLLPFLEKKDPITPEQLIDWIKNIHRRVGNHLSDLTPNQNAGEYSKHCTLSWHNHNITKMINTLLEHTTASKLATERGLISQLTKLYQGPEKTIITLLGVFDKIISVGSDAYIMQNKLTSEELKRPGYVALRYLPIAYFTPTLLTAQEKKIIDKFVKIGMLPKLIPDAVEKYAEKMCCEYNKLKRNSDENDKIRFLTKLFYGLNQINPFINANARVASCLMNLFATAFGLPNILLYNPHELSHANGNSLFHEAFSGVDSNEMICGNSEKLEALIKFRIKQAKKAIPSAATQNGAMRNPKNKSQSSSLLSSTTPSAIVSERELYQQNIGRQVEIAQLIKQIHDQFPWFNFSNIDRRFKIESAQDQQFKPIHHLLHRTTLIPEYFTNALRHKILIEEYERLKMDSNPPVIDPAAELTEEDCFNIEQSLRVLTNKREWIKKSSQRDAFKTYVNTEDEGLLLKLLFKQFKLTDNVEVLPKKASKTYIVICRQIDYHELFSSINRSCGIVNKATKTDRGEVRKEIALQRAFELRINRLNSTNLIDEFFGLPSEEHQLRNEESAIISLLRNKTYLSIVEAWFHNTLLAMNGIVLSNETLLHFMCELESLQDSPLNCVIQHHFYTLLLENIYYANSVLMTRLKDSLQAIHTDSRESYLHFLCKDALAYTGIFDLIRKQNIQIPSNTWYLKYHESEVEFIDKIPLLHLLQSVQDSSRNPSAYQTTREIISYFNMIIPDLDVDGLIEYIDYFWRTQHYNYMHNLLEPQGNCQLGFLLFAEVIKQAAQSIISLSEDSWFTGTPLKNTSLNEYNFPIMSLLCNDNNDNFFGIMILTIPEYMINILNSKRLPLYKEKKTKSILGFMLEEGLKGGNNTDYILTLKKLITKYPEFFGKLGPNTWIIDSDPSENPAYKQGFYNTISRLIAHTNIEGVKFVNHLLFKVPVLFIPWISDALPELIKNYKHYSVEKQNHLTVFCQNLEMLPLLTPIVIPESVKAFMPRPIPTIPQWASSANAFFNASNQSKGSGIKKIINSMHFDLSDDDDDEDERGIEPEVFI